MSNMGYARHPPLTGAVPDQSEARWDLAVCLQRWQRRHNDLRPFITLPRGQWTPNKRR